MDQHSKRTSVVNNPLYGSIVMNEPVILKIMESHEFQRLKGIDMAGYSAAFFPGSKHTRFDHSVGAYHLLKTYNAPLEEQIFGLLHDLSHTVFSHAVDYTVEGGSESEQAYQDGIFRSYMTNSSIPGTLCQFGFDPEYIFNEANFPLQERELPELCADRIDYAFRGGYHYGYCSLDEIADYLRHLNREGDRWYFDTYRYASKFAELFRRLDDEIWDHMTSAIMFRSIGDCLRVAMNKKYLSYDDLFKTDHEVLEMLNGAARHDEELKKYLRRMNNQVVVVDDSKNYDVIVPCKSRIVDPLFRSDEGDFRKVSEVKGGWGEVVEIGMRPKVYHLKYGD